MNHLGIFFNLKLSKCSEFQLLNSKYNPLYVVRHENGLIIFVLNQKKSNSSTLEIKDQHFCLLSHVTNPVIESELIYVCALSI